MAEVKKIIKELYTELCTLITTKVPAIKWIDLWHNQVNFLEQEHQFPAPAVFLNFRIVDAKDMGNKTQRVVLQVDVYLFYETFADTYHGSWNQGDALAFLDSLGDLFAILHGSEGATYSSMRRIGMSSVDTGSAGNLYLQPFSCQVIDYAATKEWDEAGIEDVVISSGSAPAPPPVEEEDNLYHP